ncbi:MAG: hypothetical protein ACI8W7_004211 [Gammaproteobacteria bacterium]|jgi:hypothetical protein
MPGAARGRGVFGRIRRAGLVALTALGRRDLCAMCAVRGEHSVKSSEVDPRLRHPRNKSGNEVHRLENHMRSAIAVWRFELVTHVAIAQRFRILLTPLAYIYGPTPFARHLISV